ncbi:PREDICTED: uncharacterized protein LOC108620544 isoform X1 [Drosophila arizonae]|uniref:Uncharacterized protein LOC108620544 isoform X1 n=1 Tax=Drosophila arizonae TaxID=7263 RepID=A0ABM1Q0F7_DROAR|nr:PREDICTED: uncharacterized protein LOC108620544 isoform X1 [Drosophila arizonae]
MNNPRDHLHCSRRGCTYTTNRAYNLERHERNHDKGKVPISQCQPCPHCTYAAGSLHNLMRHISKKHTGSVKTQLQVITTQPAQSQVTPAEKQNERNVTQTPLSNVTSSPELKQTVKQSVEGPEVEASLWLWTTPQQQEKNFIKRSGLKGECKILERSVNLFKLYALVQARGGALDVDEWDDVAAALSLPPGSGCNVGVKYMEVLFEFEKKEEERLQECQIVPGVPPWWDDGDLISDDVCCASEGKVLGHWWKDMNRPFITVQNAIIKLIYDKYYSNHLSNSKPFQRFCVKDSWLRATMLNYQELKYQLHLIHSSAS